jgi:uncharacterized damage-inducible protein DinB
MTDRSFQQANDESRERLARLAATLTPTQMTIDLGEGWTVASALAHAGFWDRWQAARWTRMLAGEWSAQDESVLESEHLANEALHPYWAGVSASDVPALALEAAEQLDALIARASDAMVDALEGTPSGYILHRHRHRDDHLDHVERSIAAAAASADRSFVEKNATSRRRMAAIVERLRPEDMARATEPTQEGSWTIAQVLGHLLFWDRSMETRWQAALDKAGAGGPLDVVGIPEDLTDAINLPLAGLIDAWTARLGIEIGKQALAAAEAVDGLVERVAGRLAPGAAAVRPGAVNRWSHRESHLGSIERALAAARPAVVAADLRYLERNESSLAALKKLLGGFSAADLARPAGDGTWTVGQVLGHMAFWDRFLAARWRAALEEGHGSQPSHLPHDIADLLNEGLPPAWKAFAAAGGAAAIEETLAAAEEVDAIIAGLPAEAPISSILAERPALLDRSLHRVEHMHQIGGGAT